MNNNSYIQIESNITFSKRRISQKDNSRLRVIFLKVKIKFSLLTMFTFVFQPCHVVYTDYRPTPLQHYIFPAGGDGIHMVVDDKVGLWKSYNCTPHELLFLGGGSLYSPVFHFAQTIYSLVKVVFVAKENLQFFLFSLFEGFDIILILFLNSLRWLT